jgi:uncharacterized protein YfaS (alpha-2-macroglobulin family)
MKTVLVLAFVCLLGISSIQAQKPSFEAQKAEAEKFYVEGSYAKALELYQKIDLTGLSKSDSRWAIFRRADARWRAQAGSNTADSTEYDRARKQLEELTSINLSTEERDQIWAEAQESLGDFLWMRNDSRNWGGAWSHYQLALDWWAGSRDLDRARARYLAMVWKISKPAWAETYYYGFYGNYIPAEVLESALKIARSPDDLAHAHYLMAMTLRGQGGDVDRLRRVPEEFEGALGEGMSTAWYDDALYYYAEWMETYGRVVPAQDNQWTQEPDYPKALELFKRLVSEYKKGETKYYDQAIGQIANITASSVGVGVGNVFLPDSEIQFFLSWRNVKRVDFAIYAVDLARDVDANDRMPNNEWTQFIDLSGKPRVKSWSRQTDDKNYKPGQESVRVEGKLSPGAYVIEAKGAGKTARDVILVSDASLVLKSAGNQALVYYCNAISGAPISGGRVKLWQRLFRDNHWIWRQAAGETNGDGIAVIELAESANAYSELLVLAASGNQQSFTTGYDNLDGGHDQPWRIYAFTDRPAYKPGETVQWKFLARRYAKGAYSTPANQTVEFEITDPKGAKVKEGKEQLNAFGSVWGDLALTSAMPLGEYRVTFWDLGRHVSIGDATLFRLEEYKLPEFKVAVKTPEVDGKKKTYRLGEKVQVDIQADYYFGGGVADASVQVVVYQDPFAHSWIQPRDYSWYYDEMYPRQNYGGGQIIKQETLKTDATGKAILTFDTPRGQNQDFEYRVEARVTDSSRREVISTNSVRVTRQRYYVYPWTDHNLYRPQDKVAVKIKALDANDQPVAAEGRVKLTRDTWYQVWLDPNGNEVKGDELKRLRQNGRAFPPAIREGERPWQLSFQGYEHEDILSQSLKTNKDGVAELDFTPGGEGYYRLAWTGRDEDVSITGETTVWVATASTNDLGYYQGGLEVVVDKDTFRTGQKSPVMLVAPTSDRYVLLSVEGDNLYNYQLVHMTGNVKLIEIPVTDNYAPNIFLSADMVSDRQFYEDVKQVVVPPADHFLSVDVKADREEYQPGDEGTISITTKDNQGHPVAAEVALGLMDDSVHYIQQNYAADPRQFFYGAMRRQQVQTSSTFQQKSFTKLIVGKDKQLIDEAQLRAIDTGAASPLGAMAIVGGIAGQSVPASGTIPGFGAVAAARISQAVAVNGRDFNSLRQLTGKTEDSQVYVDAFRETGRRPAYGDKTGLTDQPAVQVRNDFRSTAIWRPDLVTDSTGKATVKFKFPDSVTTWSADIRAATTGSDFGVGGVTARTKKPLIARLEAPRFFVAGDHVTISAVINNNTDKPLKVRSSLDAESLDITGLGKAARDVADPIVEVPANSEKRVDWTASATRSGAVTLKVIARAGQYSDAMENNYTVYEHGIEKLVSQSGKLSADQVKFKLDLPEARKPDSTAMTVQVAGSLAVTMLDALPYLIDYPYGCTEQTMSRFLPAAITAKTLRDLGLKPESIAGRMFGGIVQKTAAQTHPKGKKDLTELGDMAHSSLDRLYDFQHADGGWGWWKEGSTDNFMTAYVVWGMALAREAGISVNSDALNRGAEYLDKTLVEEENSYDLQAWMLHALAEVHRVEKKGRASQFQTTAFENLWTNRDQLNAYTRALLALAAHNFNYQDRAQTLVRNLQDGVQIDNHPDQSVILGGGSDPHEGLQATAHWGNDGIFWRWSEGGVEATAFALRAMLAIDPKNELVAPVTNWLIKNRRGAQWSNTRDTAITIMALDEYLRQSGELSADADFELQVNGQTVASKSITPASVLDAPSEFQIAPHLVKSGDNEIVLIRKRGTSPLYYSASASFFSQEEPVTAEGNEIFVRRDYYKLVAQPTLLKGYVFQRQALTDGQEVRTGDRVEEVITIESKNNYEYLLFEDLKPAGLESVELRSGGPIYARELKSAGIERRFSPEAGDPAGSTGGKTTEAGVSSGGLALRPVSAQPGGPTARTAELRREAGLARAPRTGQADDYDYTGRTRWVYQELRERKVALFLDKLDQGVWEIRYEMRAEAPGTFHALPVTGQAMYTPEIRCNGEEIRIKVIDKK